MQPFTERAIQIIKQIPAGRVMTYGQVAAAAGNRRGARQVARILHSMSRAYDLPWHRVINREGGISAPADNVEKGRQQKERLLSEGVLFTTGGKVDLTACRHHPDFFEE